MMRIVPLLVLLAFGAASGSPEEDPRLTRARARATEGREYITIRLCDHMLAEDPDWEEVLRLRADVFRKRGDLDEASLDYERLARLRPDDSGPWFWLGTLERWSGRVDRALEPYGEAIALAPCHADALKGRARVQIARGDGAAAETDLRRALECVPGDQEASQLLAELLARRGEGPAAELALAAAFSGSELERRRGDVRRVLGQEWAAAEAYAKAVESNPEDAHSRYWIDRLAAKRDVSLLGRYDRADIVEGLEDEGLLFVDEGDTTVIVPADVRYRTDRTGIALGWELTERLELVAEASLGRESVENPAPVYDFDVLRGVGGLDHRPSRGLELKWRIGAIDYTANDTGSAIPSVPEAGPTFLASAELAWTDVLWRIESTYDRSTFIGRGFAGDSTFRIFTRNEVALAARRRLPRGFAARAKASGSRYDDGNEVFFGLAGVEWYSAGSSATLRYRHDPLAARFLGEERELVFVDYDVVTLSGRADFGGGVTGSGEALGGIYGETRRIVVADGVKTEGPLERNRQGRLRVEAAWAPPRARLLGLGGEYFYDHYEFDTGDYNTNNLRRWELWAELDADTGRVRSRLRYTHGFLSDQRAASYSSNAILARVEGDIGRIRPEAELARFSVEGRWWQNTLDETGTNLRIDVTVPF